MPEKAVRLKAFRVRWELSGKLMVSARFKVRVCGEGGDLVIGAGQASASAFGLIESSIPRKAFRNHHMLRRTCERVHTLQN